MSRKIYCEDCVDGHNVLSWLAENGELVAVVDVCETCGGTGEYTETEEKTD